MTTGPSSRVPKALAASHLLPGPRRQLRRPAGSAPTCASLSLTFSLLPAYILQPSQKASAEVLLVFALRSFSHVLAFVLPLCPARTLCTCSVVNE